MDLSRKIVILNWDTEMAQSQKTLLETHEHHVELAELGRGEANFSFGHRDILLVDVDSEKPQSFSTLDTLFKRPQRPKMLITAFEGQIFEQGDRLGDGDAQILFKPFRPNDLLAAIRSLHDD